jgi:hypothetical protein
MPEETEDRSVSEKNAYEQGYKDGLQDSFEAMDCDEMYDLLPGDGQDDYIIGEFQKMQTEAARKRGIKKWKPVPAKAKGDAC